MELVLCDDNLEDLEKLEGLLIKYSACYPGADFKIEKFSDASKLLYKIKKGETADIYILDIVMSKVTGIDLGSEIRKHNNKSVIIYVTTSDSFALDAYDVHAIRYLLKPIGEHNFFEALHYALSQAETKKEAVYLIKTKDGLLSVPHSKIEFVESSARRLEIHLTSGDIITSLFIRKSFDEEIKELLTERSFLRIHKSFLINLNYVNKLTRSDVAMDSGAVLPISRKSALEVKKEYLLFISEQYR